MKWLYKNKQVKMRIFWWVVVRDDCVLILRGNLDTDMHRGKTFLGPWKMTAVYKPGRGGLGQLMALRRNQLCPCFDFGFLASGTMKEGASTG